MTRHVRAAASFLPSLVVLLTLEGCAGPDPASAATKRTRRPWRGGEAVFVGTCSGYCHAVGITVGDVPNLFDCGWIHGASNQEISNTIANGVPRSSMVAFAGRLPDGDEDIWKIIAFLKSEVSGC